MHTFITFDTMRKCKENILGGLCRQDYRDVRRDIVSLILATDLQQHFEVCPRVAKPYQPVFQVITRGTTGTRAILLTIMIPAPGPFSIGDREVQGRSSGGVQGSIMRRREVYSGWHRSTT
jgi:hypothetical protein